MANTFIHKHYEKVILAGLLLLFSGLLYLQLSVVQESQAKKVDGIVNAVEPPADFQKTDYTEKKYSKEVLFDENVLVWNNLWDGENPYSQSEYSKNIDMMVPQQLALCKHDSHLTYAGYYPKKDSKTTGKCLIEKCGKILEAPKNEVAKALEEEKIDNDINKNGIPDDWEKSHGFASEIPNGTKIISVRESDKSIMIDLSSEFEMGGGAESIYTRIKQIIKTANANTNLPVYLYINGKQANVIGGEGIMIKQPLSEKSFDE